MAAALMGRMIRGAAASALCRPITAPGPPTAWLPARMMSSRPSASKGVPQVPVEIDDVDDDDEEWLGDQPAFVQRRVRKLKEVQTSYDGINTEYQKELAVLQAKYQDKYMPLFDIRRDVITGSVPVDTYDVQDDDQKDGPIPEFWLTAFFNNDKISPYVTERDAEVLKHLVDVRSTILTGDTRGFELTFYFSENKFFSNKTLTKRYELEAEEDIVPKKFVGCKIDWKSDALNPTVEQKKRRVKNEKGDKKGKGGGKGDKGNMPQFIVESEPCESFFNIFDPPEIPEDTDNIDNSELDALQEELTSDFDIGFALKDQIIPRAVEWFTGELAAYEDEDYDEYDEDMDYDEDIEVEKELPPAQNKKNKGQR